MAGVSLCRDIGTTSVYGGVIRYLYLMVVETNKHNSKGSPCSNETQQSSGLVSD